MVKNRMSESVEKRVKAALAEIKPQIQADGGDIELVSVEGDVAKVRLKGACNGCPMSGMTMQYGVVNCIKKRVPEIKKVELVQ